LIPILIAGMGPGYAFEINTLVSPLNIFIGDAAAEAIKDAETALEKATASRGLERCRRRPKANHRVSKTPRKQDLGILVVSWAFK
jgi:hypothetical protein